MRHFMIDIETLALDVRACVWQFGMVEFDLQASGMFAETLLDTMIRRQDDRVFNDATIEWTLQNGDAAGYDRWCELHDAPEAETENDLLVRPETLHQALFTMLPVYEDEPYLIWCKSASFDFATLKSMWNDCGLQVPWHYRAETDMRAFLNIWRYKYGEDFKGGTASERPHNAAEDAFSQAQEVRVLMAQLLQLGLGARK